MNNEKSLTKKFVAVITFVCLLFSCILLSLSQNISAVNAEGDSGTWTWSSGDVTDSTSTVLPNAKVGRAYSTVTFTVAEHPVVNELEFDVFNIAYSSTGTHQNPDFHDTYSNLGDRIVIEGTPYYAGTYTVVITLNDSYQKTYTLTVEPIEWNYSADSLATAVVGVDYSKEIWCDCAGLGGTEPSYTITSGSLPAGLTQGSVHTTSCIISGTPTTAGSYTFTITYTTNNVPLSTKTYTLKVVEPHVCDDSVSFYKALDLATLNEPLTSGYYYLYEDITLTSKISIGSDANVTICLNGHVLNLGGVNNDGTLNNDFFHIENNGTLNIRDCDHNNTSNKHYFEPITSGDNEGLWVISSTTTTNYVIGGVITGGYAYDSNISNVGYGGAIKSDGPLNIKNVNIIGNISEGYGGAIYNSKKTNIYGSVLKGNITPGSNGGAIYSSGLLLVKDSTISDNKASNGGAIYVSNTVATIINSTVSSNKANNNGAGVFVSSTGCFIEGTKVAMANGTTKNIEDIVNGDMVKTFDHETGTISNERVCYVYKGEGKSQAFTLNFTHNINLSIVAMHTFLEKSSLKYVTITENNVNDYIGKYFYNATSARWEQLLSVSYSAETYNYYAITTANHLNSITNDMLSAADDTEYNLNVFDFDDNLKINQAKKQADIAKYGLFTLEQALSYGITQAEYDDYNIENINIIIGKGMATFEQLHSMYKWAKEYLDEQSIAKQNNSIVCLSNNVVSSPKLMTTLLGNPIEVTCETYSGGVNNTLIIGSNVTITNNTKDENLSNVYLLSHEYGTAYIKVIDSATNINVGLALSSGSGNFALNVANNSYINSFTSDSDSYKVATTAVTGDTTTYTYSLEELHSVTYNSGWAEEGNVPTNDNTYIAGETFVVAGNTGNLVLNHYTFVGWNTSGDGEGDNYKVGDTFTVGDEDVILYAMWKENPVFDFMNGWNVDSYGVYADSDGFTYNPTTYIYDSSKVRVNPFTDDTVITFGGWSLAINGKDKTSDTLYVSKGSNGVYDETDFELGKIYYAIWLNQYGKVVTFEESRVSMGYEFDSDINESVAGWTWNAETKTLTLENATFAYLDASCNTSSFFDLDTEDSVTVVINGNNSFGKVMSFDEMLYEDYGASGTCFSAFLYSCGDITITGSGTLTIYDYLYGIKSESGDIIFDNNFTGVLTIYDKGGSEPTPPPSCAIIAGGDVVINNGVLNLYNDLTYAISAGGDFTITGGKIVLASKNQAINVTGTVTIPTTYGVKAKTLFDGIGNDVSYSLNNGILTNYASAKYVSFGYFVTYDLNNGIGTLPTNSNLYSSGETFTIASRDNIMKSDYTFVGWSDGTTTYSAGAVYTIGTSNVELTAQWTKIITTQPSGSVTNDYTVVVDSSISGESYQWYKRIESSYTNDLFEEDETNPYLLIWTGKQDEQNDYIINTPGLFACNKIELKSINTIKSMVKFNYSGSALISGAVFKDDHYEMEFNGDEVGILEFSESSTITITEFIVYGGIAISGETNAQLGNVTEDEYYYCIVTLTTGETAISNSISTTAITFNGNGATSGNTPNTVYQLEGRTITLPTNPFARDNFIFNGWSDGTTTYSAGAVYTIGANDVTFSAVWEHYHDGIIFDKQLTQAIMAGYVNDDGEFKLKAGNYYLTEDITTSGNINKMIQIDGVEVKICLNGHKLSFCSRTYFYVKNGGTLKLYDCGTVERTWKNNENKAGCWIEDEEGSYTTYGGVITATNDGDSLYLFIIINANCSLSIDGVDIIGFYSNTHDSLIYVEGNLTLKNCNIKGNSWANTQYSSSPIYVGGNNVNIDLENTHIEYNYMPRAVSIGYSNINTTIGNNVTIKNNYVSYNSNQTTGLYIINSNTLTFSSSSVTGVDITLSLEKGNNYTIITNGNASDYSNCFSLGTYTDYVMANDYIIRNIVKDSLNYVYVCRGLHVTYSSPDTKSVPQDNKIYYYGDSPITLNDGSGMTKSGYIFEGWKLGDNIITGPFTIQNDTTFTAEWLARTIVFNDEDGQFYYYSRDDKVCPDITAQMYDYNKDSNTITLHGFKYDGQAVDAVKFNKFINIEVSDSDEDEDEDKDNTITSEKFALCLSKNGTISGAGKLILNGAIEICWNEEDTSIPFVVEDVTIEISSKIDNGLQISGGLQMNSGKIIVKSSQEKAFYCENYSIIDAVFMWEDDDNVLRVHNLLVSDGMVYKTAYNEQYVKCCEIYALEVLEQPTASNGCEFKTNYDTGYQWYKKGISTYNPTIDDFVDLSEVGINCPITDNDGSIQVTSYNEEEDENYIYLAITEDCYINNQTIKFKSSILLDNNNAECTTCIEPKFVDGVYEYEYTINIACWGYYLLILAPHDESVTETYTIYDVTCVSNSIRLDNATNSSYIPTESGEYYCIQKVGNAKRQSNTISASLIEFDSNTGIGTMNDEINFVGETITLPSVAFTKAGYRIIGWTTDPNSSTIEYALGAEFTFSENNMTLYAIWVQDNNCIIHWILLGELVTFLMCLITLYLLNKKKFIKMVPIICSVFVVATIIAVCFAQCNLCYIFAIINIISVVFTFVITSMLNKKKRKKVKDIEPKHYSY